MVLAVQLSSLLLYCASELLMRYLGPANADLGLMVFAPVVVHQKLTAPYWQQGRMIKKPPVALTCVSRAPVFCTREAWQPWIENAVELREQGKRPSPLRVFPQAAS